MSKFARRARWLQEVFTPSVVPTSRYPETVSEDVSLVSPYDGGGWGMEEPRNWIIQVTSAVGATGVTVLKVVGENSIFRLLGVSALRSAGTDPTWAAPYILEPNTNNSLVLHAGMALDTNNRGFTPFTLTIVPPTYEIRGTYNGGGAATSVLWVVCGVEMPLGMSPTI